MHKLDIKLVGMFAGVISVAAGVPGTILGGYATDRLRRTGRGGRMLFSACAALASIPLWLIILFSDNLIVLAVTNFILLGLVLMWVAPAAADVHEIAGPQLRGLGIGIYFFTVMIAAYGIGSLLIGRLNDWAGVTANPQMMRYTLLVCPVASLLGAVCLWLGSRSLERSEPSE